MSERSPRRQWWSLRAPKPRTGDRFTDARQIINAARLVLPPGAPQPRISGQETAPERRRILAAFLREHGVPVPDFIPAIYGWRDAYTGALTNPDREPGADGRTHC